MTDPAAASPAARLQYELLLTPGTGRVAWATEPSMRPDGATTAVTGTVANSLDDVRTHICLLHSDSVALEVITDEPGSQHGARWSPDGRLIAYINEADHHLAAARLRDTDTLEALSDPRVSGALQAIAFSPNSTRVLFTAAEPHADIGDTQLTLDLHAPLVRSANPDGRRRTMWLHDLEANRTHHIPFNDRTVWEAGWAGDHCLAVVASNGWREGDWFHPNLYHYDIATRTANHLPTQGPQLAKPLGNTRGTHVAVIEGLASDRGNLAGRVRIIAVTSRDVTFPDLAAVDVTDIHWLEDDSLGFIGVRGQQVVAGVTHPLTHDPVEVTWADDASCGRHIPTAGFSPRGDMVVVRDDYCTPPVILRLDRREGPLPLISLAPPETAQLVTLGGTSETVTWKSADGTVIHGTLCRPRTTGPHPLILHAHGGPVGITTNAWHMQNDTTRTLVAAGYAVLHPNPRGSQGRGPEFVGAVLRDMGGADALDLVAGTQAMVDRGIADPERIGVAGTSYGGFMAAWLPTVSPMFRAAVAMSPVTDWASLYYTSNIPGFVELFIGGTPTAVPDEHRRRSPMSVVDRNSTPTLLMTGGRDLCTPAEQAARLHGALALLGTPTELVIYPDEGHGGGTVATQIDQASRALAWFDRYLRSEIDNND